MSRSSDSFGKRGSSSRPPVYIATSPHDDRPYLGDRPPPVRLTNAPLLFATTLSLALGMAQQAEDRAADVPDTDPTPSSAEPSTDRMVDPPSW